MAGARKGRRSLDPEVIEAVKDAYKAGYSCKEIARAGRLNLGRVQRLVGIRNKQQRARAAARKRAAALERFEHGMAHTARDNAIRDGRREGMTPSQLAEVFGLPVERVREIVGYVRPRPQKKVSAGS